MVNHCLETDSLLGITHTEALLKPGKRGQTTEQALKSNQATYQPYQIFSAGQVILRETLDDGRLLIDVHLRHRLRATEKLQSDPFLIYECEAYEDHEITPEIIEQTQSMKNNLLEQLIQMTRSSPDVSDLLGSAKWQQMDPVEFSFRLFGILQLGGDIQQQVLQCRSPIERLNIALQLLKKTSQN